MGRLTKAITAMLALKRKERLICTNYFGMI